jgi:outer membrane receptor protein involved in Fe transport
MRRAILLLALLGLCTSMWLSPTPASAQAVYGSIFGTITDPQGAAVAGAKVTVTNVRKGTTDQTTTNASGNYNVTHLIPDVYNIKAEAAGFKPFEATNVTVSADTSVRLDGQFSVGGATETVEVIAEAPQLKTDRADVATIFSEKQVEQLPIFNRNFTQFVLLSPGTQQQSWSHASSENPQGSLQTKVNGQTFSGTGFQLDGTDNRDPILGIIVINPPLDSVTEAKITSQNYDAEFGQAIAGVVTSQTKSGSNALHGTGFGFRRSDWLQARDPFANATRDPLTGRFLPQTLWGQFGGSAGGPIIKDKLFFFGDYQGRRQKSGASFTQTVPSQLVRDTCLNTSGTSTGCDLSEYLTLNGQQAVDPQTGLPFAGNIIPLNRLSPQALAIIAALPAPNHVGPSPIVSNFAASGSGIFNSDQFDVRIDDQATNNLHVFGRYSFANYSQDADGAFGVLGGRGFGEGGFAGTSKSRNQSIAAGFDYALSSTLLTDFRFGFVRYHVNVSPLGVGTTPASDIGIPGLNLGDTFTSGQPGFFIGQFGDSGVENTGDIARTGAISGVGFGLGINRCNCPLLENENGYQFVNNWTKILGNHSFKFGADIRYATNLRVPSDRHRAGELSFRQARTGVALATFLLGDVSSFTRYVSTSTDAQESQKRWFFYGQDTWRITPKLTFSYGLRWEIYFPEKVNGREKGGLLDLTTGDVLVAGVGGINTNFNVENSFTNLAPRLGIAYQVTPKSVIRMGYGRSFDTGVFGSIFGHTVTQNLPVLSVQDNQPSTDSGSVFTLAQGPPAPVFPAVPSDGRIPLPNGVFERARPLKMRVPTLDAFNVTFQHQLTQTMSAEIAYVGNKGTHGFVQNNPAFNANQATVVGFQPSSGPHALPTCPPGVTTPQTNCGLSQDVRKPFFAPFGWTQGIDYFCNCTSSNYHSLQAKLEKRFSNGLQVLGHYTWSKSLDYDGGYYAVDPAVTYGPDDFNRKHVFLVSQVYELPIGKGKKFLGNANRLLDLLVGGFQVNSVLTWQSGLPFTPSYANCSQDNDVGICRAIIVGSVSTGGSRNGFFTTAPGSLSDNGVVSGPYQRPEIGQFGNKRNSLYGPGFFNTDLSVFKNFLITERFRGQFRAEVFNVFNHVNLGQPNGCVDCGGAGTITSIAPNALMRNFQFGLRVEF